MFVMTFALLGCATAQSPNTTPAIQPPGNQSIEPVQLRVGFAKEDNCPVSASRNESVLGGAAIAIAADVGGKLIGGAIDALANYLSSDKAVTYTATARMDAFAISDGKGAVTFNTSQVCLIAVVGRTFGSSGATNLPSFFPDASLQSASNKINKATGLSGPALLYLEGMLSFNDAPGIPSTAFTFIPKYWYYPDFIAPDSWRFSASRDVLLRIELSEPGKSSPFSVLEFQWNGVEKGKISNESVRSLVLPWSALPDGLGDAASKNKTGNPVPVLPVNVKAIFTETAKPYVVLQYLGEALKAQKQTLVTETEDIITQSLSQQARVTARQTAIADIEKKYSDYSSAYDAAKAAYDKYTAATTNSAKLAALAAAKIAYAKLDAAKTLAKAVYGNADLGPFQELPPLPSI